MNEKVQKIVNMIPTLEGGKRLILGIDGLSRSGKTTLVKQLVEKLKEEKIPSYVFHIDDHIVNRNKRYHTGNEEWYEYYQLQWDVPGLSNQLFNKIKWNRSFSLPYYIDESDIQLNKRVILPYSCVVIIEGVFLQRKEWRNYFDFLVYLDCPREKRFNREGNETKKNLSKFENRYWKAEEFYLKQERPMENANLVLSS